MSKLAIIGTIEAVPAVGMNSYRCSQLIAIGASKMSPAPLNLRLVPEEDETKELLFDVYADAAAFELHRSAPSIAQWRKETAGMVARVEVTRCILAS